MKDSIAWEIGEILVDIKKSLEKLAEEVRDLSIEQSRIGDALLDIRDVLSSKNHTNPSDEVED